MLNVKDAHKLKKKKSLGTESWYTAHKPVWEKTTHGAVLRHAQQEETTD